MVPPELSARLRYLNESAHLLAVTAPEVSRHLMSKYNALLVDNDLDPMDSQRRRACGACGTIIIIGWEGRLEMESRGPRKQKRGPIEEASKQHKAMLYICHSCGSKTRFPIPSSSKPPRHKEVSSRPRISSITKPSMTAMAGSNPTTSTTSLKSKKRAKSRKQSGLGAILAKQKESLSTGTGFGLDLMDFMKKS